MKNTINTTTEQPKLFLTDYASYNEGRQFEFGHWINLLDYSDAEELMDYITEHFKEADKKSPLLCGSRREEIMFTDYEYLPECLYDESLSIDELQKIYDLYDFMSDNNLDSLENEGDNLVSLWNEYCSENNIDNYIYEFNQYQLETMIGNNVMDAFRAGCFAEINWGDDYLKYDGYGNILSISDPSYEIDETLLIDWIIETKI